MNEPKVSILMAVYNGWESTLRTLRALLEATRGVDCETLVLDDASTDETRLALPHLAGVTAARSEARMGVPRALGAGIGAARGKYLLFLAQGSEPRPGFLAPLVAALDADPGLAAVGPVLTSPSGAVESAGLGVAYAAPLPLTPFPLDQGKPASAVRSGPVAALSGACLLVRAEALAQAGGLDHGYAEAFWDIDLSFRLAARDGRMAVVRESAVVTHGPFDWSVLGRHPDDLSRFQRTWAGRFDAFTVDRRLTDHAVGPRPQDAPPSVVVSTRDAVISVASVLEDVALNPTPSDGIMYNGDLDKGYYLDQYIEKLLSEKFGVDRDGVFVDAGAYHPIVLSNSYYFESRKNFKVLCVEANPVMARLLRTLRKDVFEFAASDRSGEVVEFQVVRGPWDPHGYGGSGMHTYEGVRGQTTAKNASTIENITVTTKTLNDILTESNVSEVDALSVDVEGHELNVLNGLNFDKYKPKVCCIENYFNDKWLPAYMKDRGYEKVIRLHVDDLFIRTR